MTLQHDILDMAASLPEVLDFWAREKTTATAFSFLDDGESLKGEWSYAELATRATMVAEMLIDARLSPGDRVLLLYPPGLDFIAGFFGCLYAGMIAVPVYPPVTNEWAAGLARIAADCGARTALSVSPLLEAIQSQGLFDVCGLRCLAADTTTASTGTTLPPTTGSRNGIAFIQYTSGSTGTPKGVAITHGNILANERAIRAGFRHDDKTVVVGWLPMYHDMGLIGNVLQPLCVGGRCILMNPVAFLERPVRWLRAITDYRATTSGGPNFAYELCVRKIVDSDRVGLDLTSWSLAFNGAEPVRAATLTRFGEAFGPMGFRRESFYPCYGLAEATLFVAGGDKGDGYRVVNLAASQLRRNVLALATSVVDSQSHVSCGRAALDQEVRIVDPLTMSSCQTGHVGEIWAAGPNIALGYWRNNGEHDGLRNAYTTQGEGPYLRTGDLGGFLADELVITGRIKDLINVRGQNYYPHDLESLAGLSRPALRQGCGVAFAIESNNEEGVVVIQEVRPSDSQSNLAELCEAISNSIRQAYGLTCFDIVLVTPHTVLKTSSGKVRRSEMRAMYLRGRCRGVLYSSKDMNALKATRVSRGESSEDVSERRVSVHRAARRCIADVLRQNGAAEVSLSDDMLLATLGIDSVMAAQLAVALEVSCGARIGTSAIMRINTVRELFELVEHYNRDDYRHPESVGSATAETAKPPLASHGATEAKPAKSWRYWSAALGHILLIGGLATLAAGLPFAVSTNWLTMCVSTFCCPFIFAVVYALVAGMLSRIHVRWISRGEFERKLDSKAYRGRRLYGVCWTVLYYCGPVYFLVLNVPWLRWAVFRLFGYRGSMNFTLYPDTWIRDLPLLRISEGAYLANRATLGTNMVLPNGRIAVDTITIGTNAIVGHLTVLGPGVSLGIGVTVANNCILGAHVKVGDDVHVGADVGLDHGVHVETGARIGSRAYVARNVRVAANTVIDPGSIVLAAPGRCDDVTPLLVSDQTQ